eukprot:scaffold91117_cov19-Tisochrysis_lutea.AAC.3
MSGRPRSPYSTLPVGHPHSDAFPFWLSALTGDGYGFTRAGLQPEALIDQLLRRGTYANLSCTEPTLHVVVQTKHAMWSCPKKERLALESSQHARSNCPTCSADTCIESHQLRAAAAAQKSAKASTGRAKNLSLLSFGEDEEAEEQANTVVPRKIRAAHDVLQDERLIRDEDLPLEERVALERPVKKHKDGEDKEGVAAALSRTRELLGGGKAASTSGRREGYVCRGLFATKVYKKPYSLLSLPIGRSRYARAKH